MRAHPQATPRTRPGAVLAVLLGVLWLLCTPVPAHAATRTVTLTASGPSPARLVLARGDRVQFVNGDTAQHQVTSQAGWHYDSGLLAPGATSALTPSLTAAGTYRYTDTRSLVVVVGTFDGSLVVPAAAPSPTPSPTASRSATPRPTPSATASRPASPPASAGPTAGPLPSSSATAVALPTPSGPGTPSPSGSPSVSASPGLSPLPDVRYGDPRALVQGSPHSFGLPVLLGLVGIGGVASLLVRLLLALAPASRRTGDEERANGPAADD